MEQSKEGVAPSQKPWYSCYWKREPSSHPRLRSPTLLCVWLTSKNSHNICTDSWCCLEREREREGERGRGREKGRRRERESQLISTIRMTYWLWWWWFYKYMEKFILFIILFTNPSARVGYDTRSIFKRSLTGFNSEFSFS